MSERKSVAAARKPNAIWESVRTILYAVLIALVIRTVAYEPFNIPSGSMKPGLLIGDYLFVSKYSYGYSRYSLPLSLDLFPGRILYSQPERGDVAVFKVPTEQNRDYIKRIVGLPGDTIQVIDGILHVNGVAMPREAIEAFSERVNSPARGVFYQIYSQFIETLPTGDFATDAPPTSAPHTRYKVLEERYLKPNDNTEPMTVPPDHFFMMGDNRDNSQDSRAYDSEGKPYVGFVPAQNLVGRAEFIFFSERCGEKEGDIDCDWWQVWKWPEAIRWGRLFQSID